MNADMSNAPDNRDLAEQVLAMAESIRTGKVDPLELRLTEAYQRLRELAAQVDSRLDIDEMLNEILGAKVSRVQELARILASPEVYVERVRELGVRELARMMVWHQPVVLESLDRTALDESLNRVVRLMEAMSRERPEESIPESSGIPPDFSLKSQRSVFLEDLERFLKGVPKETRVPFSELVFDEDPDTLLRNFLYVVVLISRGDLEYDPVSKMVLRRKMA
ncbi:MAG: hypothetical protein DRP09_06705 [Candidatus Thorarchaeota archaeon]|nr:MAG: hypothetical protein DRP09_06705 [Candidatus Thorarchaeota archaeon]